MQCGMFEWRDSDELDPRGIRAVEVYRCKAESGHSGDHDLEIVPLQVSEVLEKK